jgi:phospholipid/cholesterol/gamma-HCH transport system ATP-binding protein
VSPGRRHTDPSEPAIALRQVTKRYGERVILDAVDLEIPRGQTTVLLGPSGTGKSTLLKLAVGLEQPTSGSVEVLGRDVGKIGRGALLQLRRRMGMLFQEGALFASLTVGENIAFPLKHVLGQKPPVTDERVAELLELVDLPGLAERSVDALSGGQRKRVALARAIALEPEIVLFDEPTSGLDPQTSAAIDALIVEMQDRLGLTFVVITHDTQSARTIAHQVGVLMDGHLTAWGENAHVFASRDPDVRAFLDRQPPVPIGDAS